MHNKGAILRLDLYSPLLHIVNTIHRNSLFTTITVIGHFPSMIYSPNGSFYFNPTKKSSKQIRVLGYVTQGESDRPRLEPRS